MPTEYQQIIDLQKIAADLILENEALHKICTDQARMIRHLTEQHRDKHDTPAETLDLRQPEG